MHLRDLLFVPKLTIALAENANVNGVEFAFDIEVKDIQKTENGYEIETTKGCYETKCIVNAAGVYADVFHNMVSEKKLMRKNGMDFCLASASICAWLTVSDT